MAKATYRADGRVEVVTVNATGTETRTAFHLGSAIVSVRLVQQLNEAFDAAADDNEGDMRGDPHAEFDAATELCSTKEHYAHENCDCYLLAEVA